MTTPRIALYPISANPPTWGHADILKRSAKYFDQIIWAIAVNPDKTYSFSVEERLEMMRIYVEHYGLSNVVLDFFSGSTVRFAHIKQAQVLIKGLRTPSDFQGELQQATGNRGIDPEMETFCLFGTPGLSVVSSTLVRELASLGESVTAYLHPEVAAMVEQILKRHRNQSS